MNDFSLEYVSKTYQNYSKPITVPRVAIEALVNKDLKPQFRYRYSAFKPYVLGAGY